MNCIKEYFIFWWCEREMLWGQQRTTEKVSVRVYRKQKRRQSM